MTTQFKVRGGTALRNGFALKSVPLSGPIVLPIFGIPLFRQVQQYLALDSTLCSALGNREQSIFPNFTTDGPSSDRSVCPTPFLIVVSGGTRSLNTIEREFRVIIEVHDDIDHGDERWLGILSRIKQLISTKAFRPTSDGMNHYSAGLYFEDESPANLPDTRYDTFVVQVMFCCRGGDRTSGRGYS